MNYTYKFFPGRGYAGLVNGKIFTGYYDERDLEELKSKLQNLENQTTKDKQEKQKTEKNKSFREWMRQHNPSFTQKYEEFLAKKNSFNQ
jgi:hypothetical protein